MPPKLIIEVVGNDSGLQRTFASSSRSAQNFDRSIGKATRGALAGTGVFRSLGRSIAFASGGFLAFATAGEFLRKSIDAARDAKVTQAQLAAQFRAAGVDLGLYQKRIETTTDRLSLLAGFQNDELKGAFTTIFRTTQNVTKSLNDLGLAADLARAKHLGLSQAALIVAKTEAGNTTLLRRQGFQIKQNATAEQALATLRTAVAGQAKAGTTAQERFGAVLHNTEQIVGTALVPTLNRYLTSGAKWLTQMNESGKLQKDVAEAGRDLHAALEGVKEVTTPLVGAFRALGKVTGGTENEVKLLAGTLLLLKLRAKVVEFGLLAGGLGRVATQAKLATVETSLLATRLRTLKGLGTVVVGVNLLFGSQGRFDSQDKFNLHGILHALDPRNFGKDIEAALGFHPSPGSSAKKPDSRIPSATNFDLKFFDDPLIPKSVSGAAGSRFALTPAQRRAINLAGSPSLDALRAQAAFDKQALAGLQKRFDAGRVGAKSFTAAAVRLRNDLAQQESQIASILSDESRKAAEQSKAAATKARKALERSAEDAMIFLESITRGVKLGVGAAELKKAVSFQIPIGLQIAEARAQALGFNDEKLKPILLRIKRSAEKALASGRLAGQAQVDAWNTIAGINDQLRNGAKGDVTAFKHVSSAKFLARLGLTGVSGDDLRKIRAGFTQVGAGDTFAQRTPQFAAGRGGTVFTGPNHFHGITDIRKLEEEVEKRKRSRPAVRRGAR